MARLMPTDIIDEVRNVLTSAARGKGRSTWFLTAYQILNRLPRKTRVRLILERTRGGRGTGKYFAAASVVAKAVLMLKRRNPKKFTIEYFDTKGIKIFDTKSNCPVVPSFQVCGIYRANFS